MSLIRVSHWTCDFTYRLTHRKKVSHKYMFSTWPLRDTSSYAWWVWAGQPLTIEDKCPNVTCENQGCGNDKFKERNNARLVPCIIRNRPEHVKRAHVQWLYFITIGKSCTPPPFKMWLTWQLFTLTLDSIQGASGAGNICRAMISDWIFLFTSF
jgi:hypothetical protein